MDWKFPPEGTPDYTYDEYLEEKESGTYPGSENSFCRAYMEAMDLAVFHTPLRNSLNHDLSTPILEHDASGSADQIHKLEAEIRRKINLTMLHYIKEHGTTIDRWPDPHCPYSRTVFGPGKETKYELFFNYFGAPYTFIGSSLLRPSSAPRYPDFNYFSDYELAEARKRCENKKRWMHQEKGNTGIFRTLPFILSLLPGILIVLSCILNLYCRLSGTDLRDIQEALFALAGSSHFMTALLLIPCILMLLFMLIYLLLSLHNTVFWVGTVLLLITAACVTSVLWKPYLTKKDAMDKYHEAQQDLERAEASYQYLSEKDRADEKLWKELTHAWNRPFFEHCSKKYSSPSK